MPASRARSSSLAARRVVDRAAIASYVGAWEEDESMNRSVRLHEFTPASDTRRHAGEDLSVLCNVSAEQRSNVLSSTGADGRPVITVTVGAATVDAALFARRSVRSRVFS